MCLENFLKNHNDFLFIFYELNESFVVCNRNSNLEKFGLEILLKLLKLSVIYY